MSNLSGSISKLSESSPLAVSAGVGPESPALSPLDAFLGDWWVVHTKARHEKALSADLERMGISHFLPLVSARRKCRGRVIQRELPLFPCYLFLCGGELERYETLTTHRVANVIPVVDQERIRKELQQIYRIVASQQPVDLYPALQSGRRCRVIRGPLVGLEGIVLRRRGTWRVYVGVEALGQSAELEIDPALLEVVGS